MGQVLVTWDKISGDSSIYEIPNILYLKWLSNQDHLPSKSIYQMTYKAVQKMIEDNDTVN